MFLLTTSVLLVNRVNNFPPIKTSSKTTCTVMNPNVYCEKASIQDYVIFPTTTTTTESKSTDLKLWEEKVETEQNCHALLQYTTQSINNPNIESVSYFPHSSSSSQHSLKQGEQVECFYDHNRPQIVSYFENIVKEERMHWYSIKEIGYVGLISCAVLALTSVFFMLCSCWCSFLYKRELKRHSIVIREEEVKEFPYSSG